MPSLLPSTPPGRAAGTRRARRARGPARGILVVALGLLLSLVGQADAQVAGFQVGVSKFHTPTWGTNPNPGQATSGRIWDMAVTGDVAYIGGEFTSIANTLKLAGAIDGASGLPTPGFPQIEGGQVLAATSDGNGGWFIGGSFRKINGATYDGLAHIRSDGTVDANWTAPFAQPNQMPFTVHTIVRAGPWVYVGGEFTRFADKERDGIRVAPPYDRNHIARLGIASGTVDAGWDPNINGIVRSIAVSPDGSRVYAAGDFTAVNGAAPRSGVAAFNNSGAAEGWAPAISGVKAMAVSTDGGRIMVAGSGGVTAVDGGGGTVWTAAGSGVQSLALSRGGQTVYAGGTFTTLGGQSRKGLAAIDVASGAIDPGWNPDVAGDVAAVTVSEDGSKVYAGGVFTGVRGKDRKNLAAVDAATGTLDAWNPTADGAVTALMASGSQVYAGGDFTGLGAQARTMLAAISLHNGGPEAWAPVLENRDDPTIPPVVQAMAMSTDGTKLYIGGNFSHVNGVARENLAAVSTANGTLTDTAFNPGTPQGTVRSLLVYNDGGRDILYVGGDFQRIRVSNSQQGSDRPDNPCPSGNPDCSPSNTGGTSSMWSRPGLIAAFDGRTGILELGFNQVPASTGPGLVGQSGKVCSGGTSDSCGNGAVRALGVYDGGTRLVAGGTFSELGGQLGMISLNRADGSKTSWQPKVNIPIFDVDVFKGDDHTIFTAAGGAGGRSHRYNPGGSAEAAWSHTFDGDAVAVDSSPNAVYLAGHFDFVDGRADLRRKHAAAFGLNGELAVNFNPELDTSTGPFSLRVAMRPNGDGFVMYGGEFSRVNRNPQPGFALFRGRP